MSYDRLHQRLLTLQETLSSINELIKRLATIQFQPGSIPLVSSLSQFTTLDEDEDDDGEEREPNAAKELMDEIKQSLKEEEDDLKMFKVDIELIPPVGRGRVDLEREREINVSILQEGVEGLERDIKKAWAQYRRALLSAIRNIKEAQKLESKLLRESLANPAPPPPSDATDPNSLNLSASTDSLPPQTQAQLLFGRRQRSGNYSHNPSNPQAKELAASTDITSALRRTHTLLAGELSRSQFAHTTLRESTAALAQLNESYSSLDSLLSSSRSLVGTLLKSQKSDTWYLETAFWILVATIAWLVFRRWVYGPAWWLIWIPVKYALKSFYMAWMGVFAAVGLRNSRQGVFASDEYGTSVTAATITGSARVSAVGFDDVPIATVAAEHSMKEDDAASGSGGSLVDEVGKIIDESGEHQQQQGEHADANAAPRNPKKRMWEEKKEPEKQEEKGKGKGKDEL